MKILTLNMWRYYDWKKRKPILIKLLKKENPDVICFQEAIKNQVKELSSFLGYEHFAYGKLAKIKKDRRGRKFKKDIWFGNAIISKYPIKKNKKVLLQHYPKNNDKRSLGFLSVQIVIEKELIDILSVHFLNNEKSSILNLLETLKWVKKNKLKPIIAGDFNIIKTNNLKKLASKDYEISYYKKKYLSYPVNRFSYNRVPVTLDYIISHKKKFKMGKVKCVKTKASDHNAVISEVKLK